MRALESQAATLRLLSSRTTIPVPEVYALDTSRNNEIGAPFICTSFLPGKTVIKTWFEDSGPIPMEERRLLTLTSLAGCMAQLSAFAFDKIGSLCGDSPDAIPLGPCFDWDEKDDGTIGVDASGPFDSTDDYLREHFQLRNSKSEWGVAEDKLIVVIKSCLPVHNPGEGFVLCPPDFDAQNILTDSDGNVTGIIDWDLVQTLPRCVGYSRYPSWITRDWDPLMYGWPHLKDTENSPEELERYREHYCRALGAALAHRGDWSYTKKSHIWEAGWIALLNTVNRLEICRKLLQAAVGDDDDATDILYDLGTGALEKEKWDSIVDSLTKLFSVHVDPQ
ncbi:hypothetical protein VTK73DRAFT_2971 [Phialemonium thermophilum]|uniref:Aminoglycoside phosphotransferase domain-containing protein n=1 Tax=Phialemonium thermophilum TaxID=223376 RepID=A0ABR3VM30_9PEZI